MSGLDLGIAGKMALVCGSSSGLGEACARSLAEAGVPGFTVNHQPWIPGVPVPYVVAIVWRSSPICG